PYSIVVSKKQYNTVTSGLNLNVGASDTIIKGFINLDYQSDWYDAKRKKSFVHYDMRTDNLPYETSSVDNIFCSHVIEHVEEEHVVKFLKEAHRTLKPGATLRLVCPDTSFLWAVSQFDNAYWDWLKSFYRNRSSLDDVSQLTSADCLTHVSATRHCKFFDTLHDYNKSNRYTSKSPNLSGDYKAEMDLLTQDLSFDPDYVSTHISWWDFEKLKDNAEKAGFAHVIQSKFQGSVSAHMRGPNFDRTHPEMSLYVECIK
ncbi:MAG: class I SAM-dependent methyltransferase, partial [Pseudomonadota bacterium]